MLLCCDNEVIEVLPTTLIHHDKTKYVEIKWHFIKEKLNGRQICMPWNSSIKSIVVALIKTLLDPIFYK